MTTTELLSFYAPGTTFADLLWDAARQDDTVSYDIALEAAGIHGLHDDFLNLYGCNAAEWDEIGIDAGELLVWLGY